MPPKTRAADLASKLDPTALEQSGLDPQQAKKEIDATVKQATAQAQTAPPPSTSSSSSSPPTSSPSATPSNSTAPPSTQNTPPPRQDSPQKPEPWKLDPTYLEQTGLDPQQVKREVETAVRQATASQNKNTSASNQPAGNGNTNQSAGGSQSNSSSPANTGLVPVDYLLAGAPGSPGVSSSGAGGNYRGHRRGSLSVLLSSQSNSSSPANTGLVPVDYLLDQRNPANVVNQLLDAYAHLKSQLDQTVSKYSDVLQYSDGKIDMSEELKE